MSSPALYWLLQVFGWLAFFAINTAFGFAGGHLSRTMWPLTMGLCSISGLLMTHGWRAFVRRRRYLEMPLSRSSRRYVVGVIVIGFALTFVAAVWYRLFLVPDTFRRLDWIPFAVLTWTFTVAIWTLLYVSSSSFRRANVLERQRLKTELLAKDARLAVLRHQLNPHFLFNSLNSLRALIFEDTQKASQMVDRLAALLRYSLQSDSNEVVTLAEELMMVDEYLMIEKIRFEERLRVKMNIAEDSKTARLPRMLLQTLIENAVKHGVERAVTGGIVCLDTTLKNAALHITVQNPGKLAPDSSFHPPGTQKCRAAPYALDGAKCHFDHSPGWPERGSAGGRAPMKVLIVDDERLARVELRRLLAAHSEIEIAGEASNIEEAKIAVAELQPELLLLDIQMPGGTGFDLLDQLELAPQVIFTTGYDEFALQAFEVNALDYLLKPITAERLAAALDKARTRAASAVPKLNLHQQIFIKDGERCWL